MLGKFIYTLPSSARLWYLDISNSFIWSKGHFDFDLVDLFGWMICFRVLLLISSFRKMFAGVLSEKEILGSKHVIFSHCLHEPFSQNAALLC